MNGEDSGEEGGSDGGDDEDGDGGATEGRMKVDSEPIKRRSSPCRVVGVA